MPEGPRIPSIDPSNELLSKLGGGILGQILGDVPEEEKAAILGDLVDALEEMLAINRNFAQNIWDQFGDEESGELKRKPDLRDFLAAWSLATIQTPGASSEREEEEPPEGDEPPDDGEPDDGGPVDGVDVVDADFTVLGKGGKKS